MTDCISLVRKARMKKLPKAQLKAADRQNKLLCLWVTFYTFVKLISSLSNSRARPSQNSQKCHWTWPGLHPKTADTLTEIVHHTGGCSQAPTYKSAMVTVGRAESPLQQKCLAAHVWKRQKKCWGEDILFFLSSTWNRLPQNMTQSVVVPHLNQMFLVQDFLIFIGTWPSRELLCEHLRQNMEDWCTLLSPLRSRSHKTYTLGGTTSHTNHGRESSLPRLPMTWL